MDRRNGRGGRTQHSKERAGGVFPTASATPARPAVGGKRRRSPLGQRCALISHPMLASCPARRSQRNLDPSRGPGFADDAGSPAAGRDGPAVLPDSAGGGGWHSVVAAAAPGVGRTGSNNAGRVTVGANPKHRVAPAANSLSENNFAMTRHPRCQVGLDNGERSWQGRSIFHRWLPDEGCPTGFRRRKRRDPAVFTHRRGRSYTSADSNDD